MAAHIPDEKCFEKGIMLQAIGDLWRHLLLMKTYSTKISRNKTVKALVQLTFI